MFPATGSRMTAANDSPSRPKSSSTASRSLKGKTAVSLAAPLVTPGLSGRPSVATPEPAGAHRRLRPGVGHPHHLDGGHRLAHELGQLYLELGRGAEGSPFAGRVFYGRDHGGMGVSEDERTVAHHVVHVRVAVHIEDARALAAFHEKRVAPDRPERPHRAVHATRHAAHSPLHKPGRAVHRDHLPGVYALTATLQTRELPPEHCSQCIIWARRRS